MITPLKAEGQHRETKPLPLGLHVLHAYTHLKNGSRRVSLVVRNVSDSQIFLKKGMPVARVVSASLVPPAELSPEMEAALGKESRLEPLSVAARQEKLLEKLNLDGLAHWSPESAVVVRELVLAYHDVFMLESNELGCTSAIEHEIRIENDEPFKERFRRIPPSLLEEVRTSLQDMLEAGAIRPSQSPWCNMVVLVWKKDGILHFCVDFRCLNTCTKKDSYPLPQIQEALESMVGSVHFSSMDFKSGFWQIKMASESQQYMAFTVGNLGFYEFTRMLFGLCNAPATFQHRMQNTLGELNLTYCVIYLDDIIVFSHTEEEHLERLRVVFERFQEFNLKLKPLKCSFFQSEIMCLAHHILWRGILPSWENVWAMQEFPMPETYMQVCAFCGLAGHYRRFIKGFANVVHPLYDVLGKEVKMGPVDLPPEAREAMAILKGKVQSTPVLVFPNFEKPFLLEMDASKEGLGVVLSQKQSDGQYHPIAFGSRSLASAEKNYHSSKIEFLALKWSVTEHFKEYLAYAPFVVWTGNNPFTYVLMTPNLDATGHRWVGALASFQFELEYQKGADNGAADALSRVPINHSQQTVQSLLEGAIVGASDRGEAKANEGLLEEHERLSQEAQVEAVKLELMHIVDWEQAQEADVALAACRKWLHLRKGMPPSRRDTLLKECLGAEAKTEHGKMFFSIRNSLILNKGLMYINTTPKGETEGVLAFIIPVAQCRMALNRVHWDAGHQGQQRTLALAQERFWWPMMVEDCRAIVRGCPCCQVFEGEVPRAPLCLIRAYAPLELVHLDCTSIESMMELNKPPVVKNVLVMTDHFMRYALAVVTKDQMAKTVAKVFYECFIAVFGVPTKLPSDRGANFMSALVEKLCSAFGIQKCRTTAYHTQCNGQVEHFHQTLFRMIGKLSHNKKAQWQQHLPELLQAYNSTWSVVTGYSPHYLMFRRCPHLPVDYYFLTVSAYEHSRRMPAYVTEV